MHDFVASIPEMKKVSSGGVRCNAAHFVCKYSSFYFEIFIAKNFFTGFCFYMQINISKSNPMFGTTCRFYKSKVGDGDEFGCNSWLFRDDVDWNKLAKYEARNFADKDKVNVVMFAVSDGSEAYTKIISQYENNGIKAKKFFPIKAYDIDEEILKAAKSGLIRTSLRDRVDLESNSASYRRYFAETNQKLVIPLDIKLQGEKILKAKETLLRNVDFMQGDMFQKVREIKDCSNTVLMCRNILGYFLNDKIEHFVRLASSVLKENSLFVIGDHDTRFFNIKKCMESYNFHEVMKNVYKKI